MEIAKIFRDNVTEYLQKFGNKIPANHLKVIRAIINCRTPVLGGDVYYCENCGKYDYSYHSCRNRHCPKCQSNKSKEWLAKQMQKLLPVKYFFVTFTIPEELHFLCRSNQKLFYRIIFNAAAEALKTLLNDPKWAGGKHGFVGVLHTWTRQLLYHPHPHFIVPAGAFDVERNKWNKAQHKFLVPVLALSNIFRGKFRDFLEKENPQIFEQIPKNVWKEKEFVTHSKPVGKGDKALKYLSNYVYRIAISNNRIVKYKNGKVTFKYKPSGTNYYKYKTVTAMEFMRRFLQHVLPDGFHKIRYFGFLSAGGKKTLEKILEYFNLKKDKSILPEKSEFIQRQREICPKCKSKMIPFSSILRKPRAPPISILKLISRKYNQQTV